MPSTSVKSLPMCFMASPQQLQTVLSGSVLTGSRSSDAGHALCERFIDAAALGSPSTSALACLSSAWLTSASSVKRSNCAIFRAASKLTHLHHANQQLELAVALYELLNTRIEFFYGAELLIFS